MCRDDTFKLLLETLLKELFTNKGEILSCKSVKPFGDKFCLSVYLHLQGFECELSGHLTLVVSAQDPAELMAYNKDAFFLDYCGIGILGIDGIQFVFFWEVFRFRNEWNIIPFILLSITERTE